MISIPTGPLSPTTARQLSELLNRLEAQYPATERGLRRLHQGGLFTGDAVTEAAINKPFVAKINSAPTGIFYGWTEQQLAQGNTPPFADLPGGRSGVAGLNPMFEIGGSTSVPSGTYVMARRAYFDTTLDWVYVFWRSGGGGGIVPALPSATSQDTAVVWAATIQTVSQVAHAAPTFGTGSAIWLWQFMPMTLTSGDVYAAFDSGITATLAPPLAGTGSGSASGSGTAITRPLYLAIGGWLNGGVCLNNQWFGIQY